MIWFILPLVFAILIVAVIVKLVRIEGHERGDDDDPWNWRGWSGPTDWPGLPPAPSSGPTPDYVPDEWVFEEFGPPRRLTKVEPPREEHEMRTVETTDTSWTVACGACGHRYVFDWVEGSRTILDRGDPTVRHSWSSHPGLSLEAES